MASVEKTERKRYEDGGGGYFEVVCYPRRCDIFRVSAKGESASIGQAYGHPDISRSRASLWIKALLHDEGRQLRRKERAARVDADGKPIPRSPNRRPRGSASKVDDTPNYSDGYVKS